MYDSLKKSYNNITEGEERTKIDLDSRLEGIVSGSLDHVRNLIRQASNKRFQSSLDVKSLINLIEGTTELKEKLDKVTEDTIISFTKEETHDTWDIVQYTALGGSGGLLLYVVLSYYIWK